MRNMFTGTLSDLPQPKLIPLQYFKKFVTKKLLQCPKTLKSDTDGILIKN